MAQRYRQYVSSQSNRNPCLKNLDEYLSNPPSRRSRCRIHVSDFSETRILNLREEIEEDQLESKLRGTHFTTRNNICPEGEDCTFLGRLLIIEDPTPSVIDHVWSVLEVDPMFFAWHISSPSKSLGVVPTPDDAEPLPRTESHDFTNVHYHRLVSFPENPPRKDMLRKAHVKREIIGLLELESSYISLAHQCISMLRTRTDSGRWLCIVLVDRPIEGRERYLYDADENGNQRIIDLPSQPLLDYRDICNFAGTNAHTEHHGLGLLDALTCSWNQEALQFDRKNPTLWSLACCPLQIVAKEWVRYIDVMRSSIMQYEYSSPDLLSTDHERNELRSDLNALRFWGRRFATARQDIEATLDFLYSNNASNSLPERSLSLLLDYYRRKSTVVKDQSRQVDEKISVVVSLINSGNGRPAEVAYPGTADRNIARLTGLTLVFVCRAFISSVFGASFANRLGVMYFPIRLVVDLILAYLWLHSTFPERVDIRAHWHTLYEYGARLFARPS